MSNSNNKFKSITQVLVIVVIVLFILSLLILGLRLGNFLPNGTDILFIEPKDPKLILQDDKKVWDGETDIEIFSISNTNGHGEITVMSGTGDNVIAPGMEGYYKFSFRNIGNIAITSNCNIKIFFEGKNLNIDFNKIPFKVRLKDFNGIYIVGDENNWVSVGQMSEYFDEKTIGKNSYIFYSLEWCWLFESGNDEFDTLLGNMSAEEKISLIVSIEVEAIQHSDFDAEGGIKSSNSDPRTGGNIVPLPYILLNLAIFIILCILIYIEIKKRKAKVTSIDDQVNKN